MPLLQIQKVSTTVHLDGYYDDGIKCANPNECGATAPVDVAGVSDDLHGSAQGSDAESCQNTRDGVECLDHNECADSPITNTTRGLDNFEYDSHMCDGNATCTNIPGNYNCTCDEGFFGDDAECLDHNECADSPITNTTSGLNDFEYDSHMCDGNVTCTNILGNYNCTCLDGYDGDGFEGNCIEIDEYSTGDHDCDADATYDNLPGS